MVLLGSSCRETAKNAKTNRWEKTKGKKKFSQLFRPKVCDMDFLQKVFNGVFELPLLRNQGAAEKIKRETDVHLRQLAKKSTYVPFFSLFF
jgi:hypothetical protein